MNRSSILRLSGILAAVAFALSFLVGAFFSLGGFALLHQFGMDGRVLSQISSGAHLPISVLLAAAFGILLQDRENLVAGLIGVVQACVGCIITFTGLIGASWVYDDAGFWLKSELTAKDMMRAMRLAGRVSDNLLGFAYSIGALG